MPLKNKKIAVLLEQQYEDLEFWYPKLRLTEEGAKVVAVAPEKGKDYPSKHGYAAKSTSGIDEVHGREFDAVIIPGGFSPDFMRRTPAMARFVADAAMSGKIVGAICHGGWMLCSADVIKGKKVTSYMTIRTDMENAGGKWVDEECVRDENIITSRKPDDLPAFMRTIIGALLEQKKT